MSKVKARVIALYLPQYHPIPENDKYWGKGFTEWVNVVQAKPLFRGHIQPRIPADLGFYDLRFPAIREEQAKLAKDAGIEGFCYWHYWFESGKMLLQRPFEEVLATGKPDFPFCLGWANHDWSTGTWLKGKKQLNKEMIAEQKYLGEEDYVAHFNYCLPAFKDHRYILVDGKPFFAIYDPFISPEILRFMGVWQELAIKNGLPGIHFVAMNNTQMSIDEILGMGFSAVNNRQMWETIKKTNHSRYINYLKYKVSNMFDLPLLRIKYEDILKYWYNGDEAKEMCYPTILPNYDRSPRAGGKGMIIYGSTPELFEKHVKMGLDLIKDKPFEHRIMILKSWNEWGETNYMEPDRIYGHEYLYALKRALEE